MSEKTDLEILAELGVEPIRLTKTATTPKEARIIAGFEDIQRFVEEHGHPPCHGEGLDIFERLYATRLDRLRALDECRTLLEGVDHQGLLANDSTDDGRGTEALDDKALLAELGVSPDETADISELRHVRSRAEVRAAEEIAERARCEDFAEFEPLFAAVREDIKAGRRETRRYAKMAGIKEGEFFIVSGQLAYVADVGEEFETEYERRDSRLRVIYDNGTESNMLLRSLQRALHRDETGRRVTDPNAGPLFDQQLEAEGSETGTIYVLRSLSDHPEVAKNRKIIHKIGVTGGQVEKRFANAQKDPTFLMAPVEIIATFQLIDINRTALENLLHRFFAPARLDILIRDRFADPVRPREWFVAPLPAIQDAVAKIQNGSLHRYEYRPSQAALVLRP